VTFWVSRRRRNAVLASVPLLVAAAVIGSTGSAGAAPLPVAPAPLAALTEGALPAEAAVLAGLAPLPAAQAPVAGPLTDELTALATDIGAPLDRATVAEELDAAGLAPELDTALASLVAQLAACSGDTDTMLARTPHADLVSGAATPDPADVAALRACAVSLRATVEAVRPVLSTATAEGPVRLWPLLAFSPGDTDDEYLEDYALSIDQGGDDFYLNNQGSNMLDLKRSLTNPAALRFGEPARGCEMTYPDSVSGRILEEPGPNGERVNSFDGPECVPIAGLLWDMGGNDTYGRLDPPSFPDTQCSDEESVRRFTTIGSGVEGVSILIDDKGDDTYLGSTGSMGAGHLGGVGMLEDRDGDDFYFAMRNGMGLGLLVGLGILRDDAGNDRYDYYMPRPLDPNAEVHSNGSGGQVDDSGLGGEFGQSPDAGGVGGRCDGIPRSLQGVGIFIAPAVGILIDREGDDSYRAAGFENQEEGFPTQVVPGLIRFAHGSQGSGFLGGVGMMFDLAGDDEYLREHYEPAPDRHDDLFVGPRLDLSFDEEGSPENGKPLDLSIFFDAE
jgi:hypothetical protein